MNPGTLLAGRYQIEKVIGTGGMGAVYSARDRRFRAVVRRCAVKEMYDSLAEPAARQRARENFEREANLLASLTHHAIPKVFDYFTEGERHYLVYEYVEGQDLGRELYQRARPLPPEKVVNWAVQLTHVLEMLHSSEPPIIFRDLKPSNVMLRPDGKIVLVDFGIAKHFQPVQKGTMIGTEGYAPPEQYEGVANPRVDIYALGASMHQLLTNTDPQEFRPFSYEQRPIRQYNPAVSIDLEGVVGRALAYDSAERWESMPEFRLALERSQGERRNRAPATGPVPPAPAIPEPPSARAPLRPASSRLLDRMADGGGTRVVGEQAESGRPPLASSPRAPLPPPAVDATQEIGQAAPAHADIPPLDLRAVEGGDVSGQRVPLWTFAAEDEVRSTPQIADGLLYIGSYDTNLYCLDVATGEFRWKYATNGGVPGTPATWGELVFVGSEDQQIHALNRRTGRMEWVTQTQGRVRSSPHAAMDHLFVGSDDGYLYALGAQRGHLVWKVHVGAPVRSTPVVGSDNVFVGAEDGSVVGVNLLSGEVAWRLHSGGPVISSPTVHEERLYFGSMDRTVSGVDQKSGWVVWRARLSDRVYSSATHDGENLYIAAVDGTLYCLELEWGKEVWRMSLGTQVTSSPVLGPDERLYIGGVDGALYAIDSRKGRQLWRFPTGGPIPGSPRLHESAVIFGSMDHRVYALPTEAAPFRAL